MRIGMLLGLIAVGATACSRHAATVPIPALAADPVAARPSDGVVHVPAASLP